MNYMCVTSHSLFSFAISLICLSIISKCIGLANFLSQIFVYMQSLCCCKRISMGFLCDAKKISENVFHWYFLSHKVYSNNCNIIIWSEWAFHDSFHSFSTFVSVCVWLLFLFYIFFSLLMERESFEIQFEYNVHANSYYKSKYWMETFRLNLWVVGDVDWWSQISFRILIRLQITQQKNIGITFYGGFNFGWRYYWHGCIRMFLSLSSFACVQVCIHV